jgi:phage-related minor tail protein
MTHCKHCGQETTAAAELAVSKMINADLLAALEAINSAIERVTVSAGDYAALSTAQGNARAAIAKAKGQQ